MSEKDRNAPQEGAAEPHDGDGDDAEAGQADLEQLLEDVLLDSDPFHERLLRAQADLVNYRRRAEDEKANLRKFGQSRLLLGGLPVIDDFERALEMVPEDAVAPDWLGGLQLVLRKLQQWMESEGVTRIEAKGAPFSPSEHEAVGFENASGEVEEGSVVTVLREGYKLHGRLLRASQVTVAQPSQEG